MSTCVSISVCGCYRWLLFALFLLSSLLLNLSPLKYIYYLWLYIIHSSSSSFTITISHQHQHQVSPVVYEFHRPRCLPQFCPFLVSYHELSGKVNSLLVRVQLSCRFKHPAHCATTHCRNVLVLNFSCCCQRHRFCCSFLDFLVASFSCFLFSFFCCCCFCCCCRPSFKLDSSWLLNVTSFFDGVRVSVCLIEALHFIWSMSSSSPSLMIFFRTSGNISTHFSIPSAVCLNMPVWAYSLSFFSF